MSVGARALVAICALSGGGGVPWLLHKINSGKSTNPSTLPSYTPLSAPSSSPTTASPSAKEQHPQVSVESHAQPSTPLVKINSENCTLEDKLQDLEDAMWSLEVSNLDTFIKVTCINTNKDTGSQMPNNWEGLFPDSLFKDRKELTKGKKFEIKTQTESLGEEKFRTVFSGSHFYDDVTGEWEKKVPLFEGDREATEVTITSERSSSEKIYLLFK